MANPLVHAIWRRLPVRLRRTVAHRTLSLLAPRLPALIEPPADAPHIVVGFLTSPSGLGQAARLAMRAWIGEGKDVRGVDLSRHFFELSDRVRFDFTDGREMRGPAHVLINVNAPYMKYVFHLLGNGFLRQKKIIAYWAWELPRAPDSWREGLERAHMIATPSEFVADAVRGLGKGPPVRVAAHPVALEHPPPIAPRDRAVSAEAPFLVVSSFNIASGFERKNPLALITAFRAAFADRGDVRLRLLASGAEHYAAGARRLREAAVGDERIELTMDAFDRDGYWRWYGRPDLFASLHRAEGFGLGLAESMCAGVPVLATNWSANAEYMSEANSLPVNFTLVPVADPQAKYQADDQRWAEADVSHAAALLRRAASEPDWLAGLAQRGQADARARFSRFAI